MSTTTQDQTPETSPQMSSASAAAKVDKKKLKILKNALKEERFSRATTEKELEAAHEKIEQLKSVINDKVSAAIFIFCRSKSTFIYTRRTSTSRRLL